MTEEIIAWAAREAYVDWGVRSDRDEWVHYAITRAARLAAERVRAELAALFKIAAEGRREYLRWMEGLVETQEALEHEAGLLDRAARVAAGDLGPLYWWLPTSMWTDEMLAALPAGSYRAAEGTDAP